MTASFPVMFVNVATMLQVARSVDTRMSKTVFGPLLTTKANWPVPVKWGLERTEGGWVTVSAALEIERASCRERV